MLSASRSHIGGMGGGVLDLILGFEADVNDVFTILLNDGTDAITDTFFGLAEGATLEDYMYGNFIFDFDITYLGGDGNDIDLTVLSKVSARWRTS